MFKFLKLFFFLNIIIFLSDSHALVDVAEQRRALYLEIINNYKQDLINLYNHETELSKGGIFLVYNSIKDDLLNFIVFVELIINQSPLNTVIRFDGDDFNPIKLIKKKNYLEYIMISTNPLFGSSELAANFIRCGSQIIFNFIKYDPQTQTFILEQSQQNQSIRYGHQEILQFINTMIHEEFARFNSAPQRSILPFTYETLSQ